MPVKLYMSANLDFFKTLGVDTHQKAKLLQAVGYEFTIEFYCVKITHKGQEVSHVTLKATSSSIMKGIAPPESTAITKKSVDVVLDKILGGITPAVDGGSAPTKTSTTASSGLGAILGLGAEAQVETPSSKKVTLEALLEAKKKLKGGNSLESPPVNGVVKLKDAKALLQKVSGTDKSSIYYTVALNERVKMAMRLKGDAVSVRVEGAPTTMERASLLSSGLQESSSGHWSMHFDLGDVPRARVIGAVIFGCGVHWDSQIQKPEEVPYEA